MSKTKYAFGYVRVSTDKQEELSPDSQEKLLKDYAKKNGIILTKIFFEIGVSGRKAIKRPEFQKMIAEAKSKEHPVDVILVWKFSRFARNQEESIVYKSLLSKKHNVEVTSVSEPLVDGPFGSLIERIIEWMDEYYSIRLSGEVTRGMTEKALRGGYQARPPLGYKIVERGKPPVIVPEEAEIVRLIFDKYVNEKMNFFDIARYLNSIGLKTSHNKEFECRSIEYIVQNPTYCGMIRWNRTVNETNEIRPKEQWIVTEGQHEPIISKELFEQAQNQHKQTYHPRGARPSSTYKHWLSGLVKCPACGRTMIAKSVSRKTKENYCYFTCYGYTKGKCLAKSSISSLVLEPAVLNSIRSVLDSGDITYRYIAPETDINVDENLILQEQLKSVENKMNRIKEAYRNGIDTLEEYQDNKRLIQKERDGLLEQLEQLKPKLAPENHDSEMLERVHSVYDILSSPDYDDAKKNALLKSIVEKIVYDKTTDTLKVYYYYNP